MMIIPNAIDLTSSFALIWFAGICLKMMWASFLSWRDKDYVLTHEKDALNTVISTHECAKDYFTEEQLSKSLLYERTTCEFGRFKGRVLQLISAGCFMFGVLPMVFSFFTSLGLNLVLAFLLSGIALSLIDTAVGTPFSFFKNFKLEDRFGFNTMTKKTFWIDLLKSEAIGVIITAMMTFGFWCAISLMHYCYGSLDAAAALFIALGCLVFSMAFEIIQIKVLTPMFNKFTPLEDGELKIKVVDLLERFGYNPKGVYVMDASKRTRHSNAYCTGWGRSKMLVLYDTLLKSFTTDEIVSIIGHELAHAKLGHLVISRAIEFITAFAFMLVASYVIYDPALYNAFGWSMVSSENVKLFAFIGFYIFGKLWASVIWAFDGIESYISRLMEFAADKYSCLYTRTTDPSITSLFKLYGENLSYPLSDPLYEAWNFSHPSLISRVGAIKRLEKAINNSKAESKENV